MLQKYQQNHAELSELSRILSVYGMLSLPQAEKLFPGLSSDTLHLIIRRLEKSGRITFQPENGILSCAAASPPPPGILMALWVMIDFFPEVIYHTASDYPAVLSFFTAAEGYDVIYAQEEKEILINHALSQHPDGMNHRLVLIDDTIQIRMLDFPGIAAF